MTKADNLTAGQSCSLLPQQTNSPTDALVLSKTLRWRRGERGYKWKQRLCTGGCLCSPPSCSCRGLGQRAAVLRLSSFLGFCFVRLLDGSQSRSNLDCCRITQTFPSSIVSSCLGMKAAEDIRRDRARRKGLLQSVVQTAEVGVFMNL